MSRLQTGTLIREGELAGWFRCPDCSALYPTLWKVRNHRCKARSHQR